MKYTTIYILVFFVIFSALTEARNVEISNDAPLNITVDYFGNPLQGGDTVFVLSNRKRGIIFLDHKGAVSSPIVIINKGGLVNIMDTTTWTGLHFKNCKYIKVTGTGNSVHKYGFKLGAKYAGINFSDLCSNCEVEFVEIEHDGFVGIQAKDDFKGNPPSPVPVFEQLVIHDCFIHNVTEGMYLGETISPGLEFRHVKIYNNVLFKTGREGIQIANMVEDVEIFNNVVLSSGNDSLYAQGNNVQVGDNSVCDVYNNILIGASQFGIIMLGSGPARLFNNYIENNEGVFVDNRKFTNEFTSIDISGNVFFNLTSNQAILNYNELNNFNISNNSYNNLISLYKTNCYNCTNYTFSNNQQTELKALNYVEPDSINYEQLDDNSTFYKSLGPQNNLKHTFNSWPTFNDLQNFYIDAGDTVTSYVIAKVTDGDEIGLSFENLPFFVSYEITDNGIAKLYIPTKREYQGVYEVFAIAKEISHGKELKKGFSIIVKLPENEKPEMKVEQFYTFYNLEKNTIPINVQDSNGDLVSVTSNNLPSFLQLVKVSDSKYQIAVSPRFMDCGDFMFSVVADDHYGGVDEKQIRLQIQPKALEMGQVVYRVNFGGPTLQGYPINWEDGTGNYTGYDAEKLHGTGSYAWHGINNTQAPDSLFGPFSFCENDSIALRLRFFCVPQKYKVRLYFSEQEEYYKLHGNTIINIEINDSLVSENLNISENFVNSSLSKEFTVEVEDSIMSIVLQPVQNPVKLNGIEISVYGPEYSEKEGVPLFAFPSPFTSHLYLINGFEEPIESWQLTDLSGRVLASSTLVKTRNLSIIKIAMPVVNKGIYIMRANTAHYSFIQKLMGGY